MGKRRAERGQSLLELAVILPVLLILLVGLVAVGYALRDYLVVVNACREGCRFAARGHFSDEEVIERVVSAGGTVELEDVGWPFLRTSTIDGPDPNTGIIVTNIPTDSFGEPISITVRSSGVLPDGTGGVRPIASSDTQIPVDQIVDRHRSVTLDINAVREAAEYERMGNHIVIVEIFFMHHPLWNNPFVPLPDPWPMYAQAEMRVVTDRESVE